MSRIPPEAMLAVLLLTPVTLRAEVVSLEIHHREPFAGGMSFGDTGPYEKIVGVAHFAVDPNHARNRIIVDLDKAPRNGQGKVEFAADVFILAPKDLAKGNKAIFYDVNNRGNKLALRFFNTAVGGNEPTAKTDVGDQFLFRRGYTVVWSGWIDELLPGGNRLLMKAPVATDNGKPIRGIVRYEMVTDSPAETLPLSRREGHGSYNPTAKGEKEGILTWRMRETDERVPIPRAQWSLERKEVLPVKEGVAGTLLPIRLRLAGGFRPGYIYELVCEAEGPIVQGLGFAGVRDLISFLKHGANSRNPFAQAGKASLTRAYGFGVSQSGRFLRHFLYEGFNVDEGGQKVFDGLMPHVAGGGLGFFDHRFAQPTRHNGQHEEHLYPGDMPPFTYGDEPPDYLELPDLKHHPFSKTVGILSRTATENPDLLPKVMHMQSAAEYWHRSGSLVHTDTLGTRDATIPDNVRIYSFGGTQHGPASDPPARGIGDNLLNPGDYRPFLRALLDALDAWVRDGVSPPPSVYPRIDNGTLVDWRQQSTGFPALPGVRYPEVIQRPHALDFGPDFAKGIVGIEPPRIRGHFVVKVPKSGPDGNDLGTLLLPDVAVPLATYAGWNLRRREAGAEGMLVSLSGSYIAFAKTRSERRANGDPRESIEERYGSFDQYKQRYASVCEDLVKRRLLLQEDADRLLARRIRHRALFVETVLRKGLVIAPVGSSERSAVHIDAIEAQIVSGKWKAPKAGDAVELPGGISRKWEPLEAGDDDVFRNRLHPGGYALFTVPADAERVVILESSGHGMVYVNGEPRVGDPYQYGYVRLPVLLRKGTNEFLFHAGRDEGLQAKLVEPKSLDYLDLADATLPELMVGEAVDTWGAVLLVNASPTPLIMPAIKATYGSVECVTSVPTLPPASVRKCAFRLQGPAPEKDGSCSIQLSLWRGRGLPTPMTVALAVRRPGQKLKRTFRSCIDGSAQYYAWVPAQAAPNADDKAALVLTLHGAKVEATGQAACFAPKPGVHVVAPTNRRPWGFDWEDWGRLDALEVLDLAQNQLRTDPRRTYLTGHSMGGHGTWHLGATYPDRFAAIGPSSGWISMWTYGGARRPEKPDPVTEMVVRAANPSDTLALLKNCLQEGVYVLHAEKDEQVPVEEARTMKNHLEGLHKDFQYHEQPGALHWWGNRCVDWPPMFEFFAKHTLPPREQVRRVDFITASPGVSDRCHWAGIEAQLHPGKFSSIHLQHDPAKRLFTGATENVARLALDVSHLNPEAPVSVELDGQKIDKIDWPAITLRLWLELKDGKWAVAPRPGPELKGPSRYGPFKDAFRNRVQFVYSTRGTSEENAWAFAKARYDAETFWVRGNGSVDVIADTAFDAAAEPDRNVILYGNADSNAAWKALLGESPVQVRRGRIRIGEREETGDDLGCLFLRPRPDSERAVVGVVTGSGVKGMRLMDRLPYFVSGVGYPDCLILGPETLVQGPKGIRAAGYFGVDWSVTRGEFAWRN
jgi:poly(3-hydroxybutyrate) depolymerase